LGYKKAAMENQLEKNREERGSNRINNKGLPTVPDFGQGINKGICGGSELHFQTNGNKRIKITEKMRIIHPTYRFDEGSKNLLFI